MSLIDWEEVSRCFDCSEKWGLCGHHQIKWGVNFKGTPRLKEPVKMIGHEGDERVGYMDGVDFLHEVGLANGGNKIYPSIENMKENCKCSDECGIVKVKVTLVEWAQKPVLTQAQEEAKLNDEVRGDDFP